MTQKKLKTVRRTVVVVVPEDVPVNARALQWEAAGKSSNRQVYRVERASSAAALAGKRSAKQSVFLIDMELSCKGANRHDFTKFVRSYVPESKQHYITD